MAKPTRMNRAKVREDWYNGLSAKSIAEKHGISLFALYSFCESDKQRKLAVAKAKGSVCPVCGKVILISQRRKYCNDDCRSKGLTEQLSISYDIKKRNYDILAEWIANNDDGTMKGLNGYLGYANYDSMRFQIKKFANENDLPWPPVTGV